MSDQYIPFSRRQGRRPIPQLGLQDMPTALRRSLWNIIEPWIWRGGYAEEYQRRAQWVWNFHAMPPTWTTSNLPTESYQHEATAMLDRWFMTDAAADDIYDFVEALPRMVLAGYSAKTVEEVTKRDVGMGREVRRLIDSYVGNLNEMLAREGSPYRLVGGLLTPVTNETEIAELEAAGAARADRFAPARAHIEEGLRHLGARPPAYADCIKQSISAIESALKIAVGNETWKMAALLRGFEEKYGKIHGSLREAIDKLYGYASDEDGVRHGATEPVTVGDAEARAMLVTCSALMNFLIRKAAK